jgi:Mg2+/Co2+ transporter CorB
MTEFLPAQLSQLLDVEILLRILLQLLLFAASAFFSGSETALFSLSRLDLRKLRRSRDPRSDTLHELLDQPRKLIISILCGNMFINVAATANLTGILILLYGSGQAAWLSTVVMVPLLLLFGEATPKTVAVSDPVGISSRIVARPMSLWVAFISPVTNLVRKFSDRITTAIVGEPPGKDSILRVDEFRTLVEEGVVSGELSAVERALIYNLMQAGSAEVIEIMTPRTRAALIDGSLPVAEIVQAYLRFRKHCVPVYRGSRDRVIGFLHAEVITPLILDNVDLSTVTLEELLRPAVMVPSTKKIDEMFDYFQNNEAQTACVLNEFGGIDGVISLDDVLNFVFSRPASEAFELGATIDHDSASFEVAGDMKLIDFNKLTNLAVDDARMTTVAGFVLRNLDRLPQVGDTVTLEGLSLVVSEMDDNRISRIAAVPASESPENVPVEDSQ